MFSKKGIEQSCHLVKLAAVRIVKFFYRVWAYLPIPLIYQCNVGLEATVVYDGHTAVNHFLVWPKKDVSGPLS